MPDGSDLPVFSLGDFNSKPIGSPLYMMYGKAQDYTVRNDLASEI
jgi:hypothetical protein